MNHRPIPYVEGAENFMAAAKIFETTPASQLSPAEIDRLVKLGEIAFTSARAAVIALVDRTDAAARECLAAVFNLVDPSALGEIEPPVPPSLIHALPGPRSVMPLRAMILGDGIWRADAAACERLWNMIRTYRAVWSITSDLAAASVEVAIAIRAAWRGTF